VCPFFNKPGNIKCLFWFFFVHLGFCRLFFSDNTLSGHDFDWLYSLNVWQRARRGKRKFGQYTLESRKKRTSVSTADEDVPSVSGGDETVKSSTDSYAVPQEKEGKSRQRHILAGRMTSPTSAEAARTLLDLPEEAPTNSLPAPSSDPAAPGTSTVAGNGHPNGENGVESQGKNANLEETTPLARAQERVEEIIGEATGIGLKECSSQMVRGANVLADEAMARLYAERSDRPIVPTSEASSGREQANIPATPAIAFAVPDGHRPMDATEQPGEAGGLVEMRHSDDELDVKNTVTGNEPIQGSSRSEGLAVGSKKRKIAAPRRVIQPQEPEDAQFTLDASKEGGQTVEKEVATQTAEGTPGQKLGTTKRKNETSNHRESPSNPPGSEGIGKHTPSWDGTIKVMSPPFVTQILKAISYSNSVTDDKQDVVVLFKASRFPCLTIPRMHCTLRICLCDSFVSKLI